MFKPATQETQEFLFVIPFHLAWQEEQAEEPEVPMQPKKKAVDAEIFCGGGNSQILVSTTTTAIGGVQLV